MRISLGLSFCIPWLIFFFQKCGWLNIFLIIKSNTKILLKHRRKNYKGENVPIQSSSLLVICGVCPSRQNLAFHINSKDTYENKQSLLSITYNRQYIKGDFYVI